MIVIGASVLVASCVLSTVIVGKSGNFAVVVVVVVVAPSSVLASAGNGGSGLCTTCDDVPHAASTILSMLANCSAVM